MGLMGDGDLNMGFYYDLSLCFLMGDRDMGFYGFVLSCLICMSIIADMNCRVRN